MPPNAPTGGGQAGQDQQNNNNQNNNNGQNQPPQGGQQPQGGQMMQGSGGAPNAGAPGEEWDMDNASTVTTPSYTPTVQDWLIVGLSAAGIVIGLIVVMVFKRRKE